jgi:hypothetical protein
VNLYRVILNAILCSCILAACFVSSVQAVPIAPCGAVSTLGVFSTPGVVIYDESQPFEVYDGRTLLLKGELQNRVMRLNSTGKLQFSVRVKNVEFGPPGYAIRVQMTGFAGYATDVDYITSSLGTQAPVRARRDCTGDAIDYEFITQPIGDGQESKFIFAATDADHFGDGGVCTLTLDSGHTISLPIVKPITDSTPPVVSITGPAPFGCGCDPIEITGSAGDPEGTFLKYTLEYAQNANGPWTLITMSGTPVNNGTLGFWNTAGVPQGYYFVRLTAENTVGLTSSVTTMLYVDQSFGSFEFRAPGDGSILGGTVCFDGTAWDNCFHQYTLEYRPEGVGQFQPVDPNNPAYPTAVINDPLGQWNTAGNPDGDYEVRMTAWDVCGHFETETHTITVDNTAPTAEITSPTNCEYHCPGVIEIHGTAFDANISSWSLQFTGGSVNGWQTIATGNSNIVGGLLAEWDTTNLEPCAYTVRLLVTDKARVNCTGNTHLSQYNVSINIGAYADCNGDGVLNVFDFLCFQDAFVMGCP